MYQMKKLTYRLFTATLIFTSVFATGCTTVTVEEGCTDPDSEDYSATAEVDDGTCTYEGAVVFSCFPKKTPKIRK